MQDKRICSACARQWAAITTESQPKNKDTRERAGVGHFYKAEKVGAGVTHCFPCIEPRFQGPSFSFGLLGHRTDRIEFSRVDETRSAKQTSAFPFSRGLASVGPWARPWHLSSSANVSEISVRVLAWFLPDRLLVTIWCAMWASARLTSFAVRLNQRMMQCSPSPTCHRDISRLPYCNDGRLARYALALLRHPDRAGVSL